MYGGITNGVRYAGRTMIWTLLYVGTEATLDRSRGTIDALNSTMSAIATAGVFSYKNKFSRQLAARTVRMSGLVGLSIGLIQDGLIHAKGGRVWYLEKLAGISPNRNSSAIAQ